MNTLTKKDYFLVIIAGAAAVLFLLPLTKNIKTGQAFLPALFIVIPVLWIVGLWLGNFLSRWLKFLFQFSKFVIVGFLNTSIDFGVLNLLSILTGATSGLIIGGINIPGFILAATNSYFWNKFWVFSNKRRVGEKTNYSDFFTFTLVVVVGAFINSGIVILLTTYINPLFDLSPERWLNAAKASAVIISLIWNFTGFKFLVFKK